MRDRKPEEETSRHRQIDRLMDLERTKRWSGDPCTINQDSCMLKFKSTLALSTGNFASFRYIEWSA